MRFATDTKSMPIVEFEECLEPGAPNETCSVVDRTSWRWTASAYEFVSPARVWFEGGI